MDQNRRMRWVWAGGIGAAVAALCCVTPVLVVLLGALGLAAVTGYLDYILLPALLVFLGMLVYGLSGPRTGSGHQCCAHDAEISAGTDTTREAKHG